MKTIKQNLESAQQLVKLLGETIDMRKETKQRLFEMNLRNASLSLSKNLI